jgi:hypothetical protein
LAKAKGIPDKWLQRGNWTGRRIEQMTNLHIWTAVAASLHDSAAHGDTTTPVAPTPRSPTDDNNSVLTILEDTEEWGWTAPDLSEGRRWGQD